MLNWEQGFKRKTGYYSNMDYRTDSPEILRDFLSYHENIKGHSKKTVDEYYLDLRNFFRYMKIIKGKVPRLTEISDVSIMDVDINLIRSITMTDIYEYLSYLNRDRPVHQNSLQTDYGLSPATRARKLSVIKSFYRYLMIMHYIEENPVANLDVPKIRKSLPRYLELDESIRLLEAIDGPYKERDYCIITLFLNCGLRVSELTNLNINDVKSDHLRVLGKGNKERIVYLNDAAAEAINAYLNARPKLAHERALFISRNNRRISRDTVNHLVKKHLLAAGIDASKYSSHKLRHTAATLMLKNGVDVRTLQEVLGHAHLNTTQIYTHVDNAELRMAAQANPLSKIHPKKK